jgi:hypothetical protein
VTILKRYGLPPDDFSGACARAGDRHFGVCAEEDNRVDRLPPGVELNIGSTLLETVELHASDVPDASRAAHRSLWTTRKPRKTTQDRARGLSQGSDIQPSGWLG